MGFTHSVVIAAPVERVWHCIDDLELRKQWQQGLEETLYTHVPAQGGPVGTRFTARIREGGRVTVYQGEVLAHEPGRLLRMRMGDRHFTLLNTVRLAAEGPGTRLELEVATTLHSWPARLLRPLSALLLRAMARKQLAALKTLAEGGG